MSLLIISVGQWNKACVWSVVYSTGDFKCIQLSIISFFRLSVCEQVSCRTITSTILYRFSRNFARGSEMWSHRRLLFVRQTESSLPILEVCGFRFWQFSGSGDHIFQQISTKSHTQIKLSNADFVLNGE